MTAEMVGAAAPAVPDVVAGNEPTPIRAFEGLANHTGRALTYLVAALDAPKEYTTSELGRKLAMLQGPNPGRDLTDNQARGSLPRAYCSYVLEPCGLVIATAIEGFAGRPALAYRASSERLDQNISLAGAVLDWELQFPQYRLFDLLGETRATYNPAQSLNSFGVYGQLVDAPDGTTSHRQLERDTGRSTNSIQSSLRFLEAVGSVERLSRANLAHRTLALTPTSETYLKQYGHRMSPASRALRATVELFLGEGQSTVSGDVLVRKVLESHPGITERELRHVLTRQPPPPFVRFDDEAHFGKDDSALRLTPRLRPAIADLVLRIRLLDSSQAFARLAADRAVEILKNRDDVAFLMAKAKVREPWEAEPIDRLTEIRRRAGSLTLKRLPIMPRWENLAACRNAKYAPLFTGNDEELSPLEAAAAKAVCAICPPEVVASCLQTALDTGQPTGVFGGATVQERARILRKPHVKGDEDQPGVIRNSGLSTMLDRETRSLRRNSKKSHAA